MYGKNDGEIWYDVLSLLIWKNRAKRVYCRRALFIHGNKKKNNKLTFLKTI